MAGLIVQGFRAYEFARQLGFDNINVDLISGMLEETDDNGPTALIKSSNYLRIA